MKNYFKTGLMTFIAIGWCGLMYPELVMNPEIINVIYEIGESTVMEEAEVYYKMLSAEPGQIEIKFRVVEYLKSKR